MSQKKLEGVCATEVSFRLDEDGIVHDVSFDRGCQGNHSAVSRLVEGRPAEEVVSLLDGITCGNKDTSCPDKLAQALKEAL